MPNDAQEDDFPVAWDDPADAALTWQFDQTHSPLPVRPLVFELSSGPFVGGFGFMRPIHVNYFLFYASPAAAQTPAGGAVAPPPDLDRLWEGGKRWKEEILPDVLASTEHYRTTDFDALSDAELGSEIEELPRLRTKSGRQHTQVIMPPYVAGGLLIQTYKELTGGDELGAMRLIQGYGNKSVDAGEALWRLSHVAAGVPSVCERVLAVDNDSALGVWSALQDDPAAQDFVGQFRAFLGEWGWRSGREFDEPTWFEDPTVPLAMLRAYVEASDYDQAGEQQRLVEEREAALKETMAGLDAEARGRLQAVVDVASEVTRMMEDHNYYLDQQLYTMPRRLVLAAARRLVDKGALAETDDVWWLHVSELTGALTASGAKLHDTIGERAAEFARWESVTPPAYIGAAPPASSDNLAPPSPPSRAEGANAPDDVAPRDLKGMGSSAGVARGPVRIVPALNDAGRLRPGDVLVTVATLPPWTPLFAIASAVVTETGGMLSHTAVTAREYGLPAVLAVANCTRLLKDGQLVEVDGGAGTVKVVG